MPLPRLIPVLLHKHGRLTLSRDFSIHQTVGDAATVADRYKTWDLDELVYLDISSHWPAPPRAVGGAPADPFAALLDAVRRVSRNCFVPLTVGGGVGSLEQIDALLQVGADRFVLNSAALADPGLIERAAARYGAQAVVVAVDARRRADGGYEVFADAGRRPTGRTPEDWAVAAARHGAGEILLHAVDRDGTGRGYDLDLIRRVTAVCPAPVIALGGAGGHADPAAPIRDGGAAAAAAANLFAFGELSYHHGKQALAAAGVAARAGVVSRDYAAAKRRPTAGRSRMGAETERIWSDLELEGRREMMENNG
jgi:imidazole glycerol-phosphate synthase subunit HisF